MDDSTSTEVDWDAIINEIDWGIPQMVEKMGEIFSYVNWNGVPGGTATLARAEAILPLHPRIGELRELLADIARDTLNDAIEFHT